MLPCAAALARILALRQHGPTTRAITVTHPTPARRVALAFGKMMGPNLMLLFLPLPHCSFITALSGVSRARLVRYHRSALLLPGLQQRSVGCELPAGRRTLGRLSLHPTTIPSVALMVTAAGWATARYGCSLSMAPLNTWCGEPNRSEHAHACLAGRGERAPGAGSRAAATHPALHAPAALQPSGCAPTRASARPPAPAGFGPSFGGGGAR